MSNDMSTEFAWCPTCVGTTEDADGNYGDCKACGGTGDRPVTEDNIRLAITARDWADQRIAEFYSDWCEVNGGGGGYGVEAWSLSGEDLHLTLDMSYRGCHNTETLRVPAKWLYATGEERLALLRADLEERARTDAAARERARLNEISRLRARISDLEAEKNN